MIRPEAQAALRRWREVLVGIALAVLALWWLANAVGILRWIAPAVLVGAGALIMVGVQKARFRSAGQGPGAVKVVEGQIAYFGPLTGGAVALSEITRLTLDSTQRPAHWVLEQPGAAPLHIPVNAAGAEALFDAFASLPGLRTERMLTQMNASPKGRLTIWERAPLDLARLEPRGRA